MATKLAISSSITPILPFSSKLPPPLALSHSALSSTTKPKLFRIFAEPGGGEQGDLKQKDKKFITKEQEPEQYWQTAGEREGENPMSTPLPYIILFGMSTPFIILAIAFLNGWIKTPIR
ncbi:5'-AMP-activated protein kinase beta-2 subunit protein [Heracleum sosnowskyi]|uniref:5'-AMP-activated protein kinase beta-2 subunit protein n=1 Tax=Heracleum sosnowskyi TaxID=360622 RepID=A0AAD8IQ36_9APIA|nr:5'-AMP-activated protein kinase beta-2 subunit protein [Heracleum sosnowskyi]